MMGSRGGLYYFAKMIYSNFLFLIVYMLQGKKRKRRPVGNLINYNCEKENCISEVQNVYDKTTQSVKGYQPAHFKITPPPSPFLKIPHPSTLPANQSSQVFLINRNATVKLSSINTIHVKQQHNVGFFIFKFTLKYMLGNVYINKIHARQCLYIISLYCREGFSHPFNFFVVSKGILHI